MSETTTQVEPWMTPGEAEVWFASAIQAHYDIYGWYSAVLNGALSYLDSSADRRQHVATKYAQWGDCDRTEFPHVARIYDVAAAILRAVKT